MKPFGKQVNCRKWPPIPSLFSFLWGRNFCNGCASVNSMTCSTTLGSNWNLAVSSVLWIYDAVSVNIVYGFRAAVSPTPSAVISANSYTRPMLPSKRGFATCRFTPPSASAFFCLAGLTVDRPSLFCKTKSSAVSPTDPSAASPSDTVQPALRIPAQPALQIRVQPALQIRCDQPYGSQRSQPFRYDCRQPSDTRCS